MQHITTVAEMRTVWAGTSVELYFACNCEINHMPHVDLDSVFMSMIGDDLVNFQSLDENGNTYNWDAYDYNGHLAYGTDADPLVVTIR